MSWCQWRFTHTFGFVSFGLEIAPPSFLQLPNFTRRAPHPLKKKDKRAILSESAVKYSG